VRVDPVRPASRWLAALAGFVLLVGAPVVAARPAASVGEPVAAPVAGAVGDEPTQPSPGAAADDPPVEDTAPPAPDRPAAPETLRIPAIQVDAPLAAVGLEVDGTMEIPDDVATVGWYRLGVAPGAPGTAVLSGHRDARSQGQGALWELGRLTVGDRIEVAHADGSTSRWQVTGRASYPKDELPVDALFTRFGEPRLAVITCDGAFDPRTRSYSHNVVVLAEPA
jgi:sortase (surface protein transpeptidase)